MRLVRSRSSAVNEEERSTDGGQGWQGGGRMSKESGWTRTRSQCLMTREAGTDGRDEAMR